MVVRESAAAEDRYRKLMRWYPTTWRDLHEEVMVSTLLEHAQHEGREAPTLAEGFSLALHGVAEHLTARRAFQLAVAGATAALVNCVLWFFFLPSLATAGLGWLNLALGFFVAPSLLAVSLAGLLRRSGFVTAVRALAISAVSTIGFCLGGTGALLWSVAFDDADAGRVPSRASTLFLPVAGVALVVTTVALALIFDALMHRSARRSTPRAVLTALGGAVVAPPFLLSLATPVLTAVAGVGLVVAFARIVGTSAPPASPHPSPARRTPTAPTRAMGSWNSHGIEALAWVAAIVGTVSAAFALTGSRWGGSLDATQSMQIGLAGGDMAAVVLVLALAMLLARSGRKVPRLRTAAGLLVASFTVAAVSGVVAVNGSGVGQWNTLVAGTALGGTAIAVVVEGALQSSRAMKIFVAVTCGVVHTVTLGVAVSLMAAFITPLAGIVVAIFVHRRRRVGVRVPISG